ncbi:MAG: hypothetical protein B6D34_07455 [Candidatus Brocadia sp. UTAMX1]|nr:MAG: hypothetical protein B6D34_07455 [Candidatus Brocadia sp. UTAMX1]
MVHTQIQLTEEQGFHCIPKILDSLFSAVLNGKLVIKSPPMMIYRRILGQEDNHSQIGFFLKRIFC